MPCEPPSRGCAHDSPRSTQRIHARRFPERAAQPSRTGESSWLPSPMLRALSDVAHASSCLCPIPARWLWAGVRILPLSPSHPAVAYGALSCVASSVYHSLHLPFTACPMSYGPVAKSLLTMPRPIAARRDCDEDELMAQRQPSERHVPTARPP
jgi:hypothetical protein